MTVSDFMTSLLDVVFFLFDKTDSLIVLVPLASVFFSLVFAIIFRLMRFR